MREEDAGVEGAKEFLGSLPPYVQMSLCQTITHDVLTKTQEDAIRSIINHSHDLESILRRKAVTRDLLIKYLHQKGSSITVQATKQDLIREILSLWINGQQSSIDNTQVYSTQNAPPVSELQIMAKKFIEWFYPLLKSCGLSSDTFWDNSEVTINLSSNSDKQTSILRGPSQILNALTQLVQFYGVVLAPSNMGGIRVETDIHGLVLISCTGTVFKAANCVGVFVQEFALSTDPYAEGDWRIKRTKLDISVEDEGGAKSAPAISY